MYFIAVVIKMFLPSYSLPKYPCVVRKNIVIRGGTDPDFDSGDDMGSEEIETNNNIFHNIMVNPIEIFIFLVLYSIWLGGFSRKQIFDYLNNENKKNK